MLTLASLLRPGPAELALLQAPQGGMQPPATGTYLTMGLPEGTPALNKLSSTKAFGSGISLPKITDPRGSFSLDHPARAGRPLKVR